MKQMSSLKGFKRLIAKLIVKIRSPTENLFISAVLSEHYW